MFGVPGPTSVSARRTLLLNLGLERAARAPPLVEGLRDPGPSFLGSAVERERGEGGAGPANAS